ncbi:MAG: aldehyde ferredoxin oxidoreductase C-terminal domain-containing protein [Syntrophobacteraceae bacterium]|jgi:aldehyde:ferredoxin oxidoreductase
MDKILRIDMGAEQGPAAIEVSLGEYAGLGGRALTSAIISREVPPLCHPLGAKNKLVIAPGLLSGTTASMSGRLSVGCKSPLTGGIKEANAGGQASQVLARLGYAAIVLEGKPKDNNLYKIHIDKDGVKIFADNSLRMLGNYAVVDKISAEYSPDVACISIGPAGEMKLAAATVACTDMEQRPTRHAARGGVGAVMGAKGVKVIVIDDKGMPMRSPKDPEGFREANRKWVEGLMKNPICGKGLPRFGTNSGIGILNEAGAYPTRNFSVGRFEGSRINAGTLPTLEKERGGSPTHGCHRGCVIQCSGIFMDKDGQYLTKQPEYETVWAHGGNCGIDDIDAIAVMDRLDDDYGVDTIEMGTAIAVAMEAGIADFGDSGAAINLVHEVGTGSYLGRILGSGAAITGKVFGVPRVPVVKGQAMAGYDPRAAQGMGVTYATSPMGADHTAGYSVGANILKVGGYVDALSPDGQVELSRNLQIATAFSADATGMCLFVSYAMLEQPETAQAFLDLLNTFYGWSLTGEDITDLGKAILRSEREFNIKAGLGSAQDRLPEFFKKELLPPHNISFLVKDEDLDSLFDW